MNVVLLLVRTRLRSSLRAALALVALIGLGGGVTLAVAAGARRTASANDAILRAANAPDAATSYGDQHPDEVLSLVKDVAGVDGLSILVGFAGRLEGTDRPPATLYFLGLRTDQPTVDRPFVLAGRLPTGPDEVLLNEGAAARTGLGPGDTATLALAGPPDFSFLDAGTRVGVEIVGIGMLADEVVEDELGDRPLVLMSRALTDAHLDRRAWGLVGLSLVGGDIDAAVAGFERAGIFDGAAQRSGDRARVQRAIRPLLGALAGLAMLAGTATAVVATQAIGRMVRRRRVDDDALAALGCTRRQLVAADLASASTVAVGGAVVALVIAVSASPLFPVGPVHRVSEVVGGIDVDAVALGAGAACLVALVLTLVGASSWRTRSVRTAVAAVRVPGPLGSSPSRSTGIRLTTGRRGFRTTVAGVSAGLAAVLAALTFSGSLGRLSGDGDLVGMSWDVVARENFSTIDAAAVASTVQDDPTVRRATAIGYVSGAINGTVLSGAQVSAVVGDPWPPISQGRAPRTRREILVGKAALGELGLQIGSDVNLTLVRDFALGPGPEPMPLTVTVVGSAVVPAVGQAGVDTPRLGEGFLLSTATAEAILGEGGVPSFIYLFDLAQGSDPAALIARFPDGLPDDSGVATEWYTSAVPAEVGQAEDARPVIWLGVGALAVAVVATIGHTLMGFVRQRRRDYAVLKALGFTRGQIRSTVLWQSGAVLAVALIAAVPVGVAAGRWLWIAFAQDLGILVRPVVPVLLVGAAVLATVLVVQGAALLPAALARRTPPGQALHAE